VVAVSLVAGLTVDTGPCRGTCHGVAQARHASLGDNYGGRIITMALRLQSDGPRNAAGQLVKDGEGPPSVLALTNESSADAKPIGAPGPGPGPAEIQRQRVCDDDPRH
jgi:hypothetical protein